MNKRNLGRFKMSYNFIANEPERAAEAFSLLKAVVLRAVTADSKS